MCKYLSTYSGNETNIYLMIMNIDAIGEIKFIGASIIRSLNISYVLERRQPLLL